jgi:hypothetical protein
MLAVTSEKVFDQVSESENKFLSMETLIFLELVYSQLWDPPLPPAAAKAKYRYAYVTINMSLSHIHTCPKASHQSRWE